MNKTQGKFLTLEGIEGVGKSSNLKFIAEFLQQAGIDVLTTREPGGTTVAEKLRQILLAEQPEPILPLTELLLLYAGRLQHVEHLIKPALAENKWVVCDRFVDATYAYQGAGRGINIEKIKALHALVLGDFFPDCTLILDAPVEVALARIQQERKLDRFEKEKAEFFAKIRAQYLTMAQQFPERYRVIDATRPLSEVQAELGEILTAFVENRL